MIVTGNLIFIITKNKEVTMKKSHTAQCSIFDYYSEHEPGRGNLNSYPTG